MIHNYGGKLKYFFIAFILLDVLLAVFYIDEKVLSKTTNINTGIYDVLFGKLAQTSYNESLRVTPNFTAYDVFSNFKSKENTKKIQSNLKADYQVKPKTTFGDYVATTNNQSNTNFASGYSSFVSNTDIYASNKNYIISTTQTIKSLDVPLKNNIGAYNLPNIALAENPVANYEPFSDILGIVDDNRFNMSQVDPGEEDPVGNPIPISDDLFLLFGFGFIYIVFKVLQKNILQS